jgi:RNA polymerase sigma-70 factor (ECF subfamily)
VYGGSFGETVKTNPSDEELLQAARRGDEDAFTSLYGRYQARIYRFALHMSGSSGVAEDVTQEVFLTVLNSDGYDPSRGFVAAYLYGIARNQVLRHLHRNESQVPMGEEAECVDTSAGDVLTDLARRETIARVREAVLGLPHRYREVVVLCELEEMDYSETAAVLGCAVGTVRSRLHRARRLLVRKLRVRYDVCGV